ncbi:MAG: transcriptional repressor, partial [bacterium]|nr:transcriptional repressor [bacterium]
HYEGDQHYYETRLKAEHAHVICLQCGKVEEFFGEPLHNLRKQVETTLGYEVAVSRTEIGGYCPHCQALRTREMEHAAGGPVPKKRQ